MKPVNQTRPQHRRTHRRAFTLVEVIVVVTIIALLATIVVPNVFGNLGSSRQKVAAESRHHSPANLDLSHEQQPQHGARRL